MKSSKEMSPIKSSRRFLGWEPVWGELRFDFLDGRRRADAEGERNETLLGGNRVENEGGGKNVVGLREDGDGLGRGRMGGDADGASGRVGRARMVMRGECQH
jgi:hypothetical protein